MTEPDDDRVDDISDEKLINLPSVSVSGQHAAELERRLEEIAEDSLSEDNPEFHALPLYMNWRLRRERDRDEEDEAENLRQLEELDHIRIHRLDKKEYEGTMVKLILRFRDVAKRACNWGIALFGKETEIRNRAIVLDDGRRVYVDGDGFVDESGRGLSDSSAVAEAQQKKKTNSATSDELQVADRAHSLAEQERTIGQQAGDAARDADSSKQAAPAMTPSERTVTAAGAGQHADELERVQSATERQAKELLNSNTASLGSTAGLAAVSHGAGDSTAPPQAGGKSRTSSSDSSDILTGLRKTFADALGSAVGSISAPDSTADTSSLSHEFSVAIARPRNDNTSARTTAAVDSIPSVRSATF